MATMLVLSWLLRPGGGVAVATAAGSRGMAVKQAAPRSVVVAREILGLLNSTHKSIPSCGIFHYQGFFTSIRFVPYDWSPNWPRDIRIHRGSVLVVFFLVDWLLVYLIVVSSYRVYPWVLDADGIIDWLPCLIELLQLIRFSVICWIPFRLYLLSERFLLRNWWFLVVLQLFL